MTRHFSIPTVLRMTPNSLLRGIFSRLGHDMRRVPWPWLPPRKIQPILAALREFSPAEQCAVERAFQDVFDLACENGSRAIREAASSVTTEKPPYLPDVGGPYGLSAWTWLHHPALFERAMTLYEVDHLSRWRKRKDVPRVDPRTTAEALSDLAAAISAVLQREEGRGRRCTVESVRRADGVAYFMAFPDDFVHTILHHDQAGELATRSIRPIFDIVFAYDQTAGALELNAKVSTRVKAELEDVFCQAILGQAAKRPASHEVYNLNVLKEGPDYLETDPEDSVTPIVHRLRLAIPESRETITLEADRSRGPNSIYRMLDECLNRERLPLSDLDVTSATIGMVLHPIAGRKPGRVTFDVARPDRCTRSWPLPASSPTGSATATGC
jgi:hypothetical protein